MAHNNYWRGHRWVNRRSQVSEGRTKCFVARQNPHPGGTAYVYRRQGFTFPMGPMGFSNRKIVEDILRDLGADADLTWQRINYELKAFNLSILLSQPFPLIAEQLTNEFPDEVEAIKSFFAEVDKIVASLQHTNTAIELSRQKSICRFQPPSTLMRLSVTTDCAVSWEVWALGNRILAFRFKLPCGIL